MTDIDITHYTVEDILLIFNIVDPTVFNVTDVANTLIAKMKTEGKPEMMDFFAEARDKVLDYLQNLGKEPVENELTESIQSVWSRNRLTENVPENPANYYNEGTRVTAVPIQTTVVTGPPIISTKLVVIDSQFRSNILPYSSNPNSTTFNTNFTFNLSSPITKAISMKLYSYTLPTSWNAFDAQAGNTFLLYNGVILNIPDGNYSPVSIVAALNAQAALNTATAGLVVAYNPNINRISFTNTDALLNTVTVVFFIQSNMVNFSNCGTFILGNFQTLGPNTTLGWLLGFRTPANATTGDIELFLPPNAPAYADVPPQTYGPSYFTLSIEDYSNQRLTSGLYNITNTKKYANLTVPDYYNTINVACKLREGTLTQAQLYSINAITQNNSNLNGPTGFNTLTGPTASATFAVIPLEGITALRPNPYIKFGGDLYMCHRNYIKPTNLERFSVSLTDDKGNLVNLYDNDWSFSLIVEEQLN